MKGLIVILLTGLVISIQWKDKQEVAPMFTPESPVADLLYFLGEPKPEHYISNSTKETIQRGKELIHNGKVNQPPKGQKSNHISKYYTCTSCHNTQREDVLLDRINQDERLLYAQSQQLPYLQASTLWAVVNRETWYNDDYINKYGDLVKKARHSLEESTQLCAEICSQGRRLENWELESIIAYYWSLQMKMKDLDYDQKSLDALMKQKAEIAIKEIKSKYLQKSPATFVKPPMDKKKGYGLEGRPEMGKIVYEQSCQHCHRVDGVSDVILDNYRSTFRWLLKNISNNDQLSIYEIIRNGSYSAFGHMEYMPQYTNEKLSNQQLEDLRAYIEQMAE